MTSPEGYPLGAPLAPDLMHAHLRDENTEDAPPTVGGSDADADAARSGSGADLYDAARDSDGVPVGSADANEDARRSGADGR